MTATPDTTPTPAPAPPATPDGADTPDTPDDGGDDTGSRASREAARYRTRLRTAEAERDTVTERLTGYQRREAERLAAERLTNPADLWLEAELADTVNDDGQVDTARLTEAIDAVLATRPQLAKPGPHYDFGGGQREHVGAERTWTEVLNPGTKRR